MKQKTTVIARNEAISEPCQSRNGHVVLSNLPLLLAFVFSLLLSSPVLAQRGDTARKDVSKRPTTLVYKTDPIILLDGVVYKGDIKSINPDDIHDITILKGNDATALY